MKFNIQIDLEDTISDMFEEGTTDISKILKGQVIHSVVRQVLPKMQSSIDAQVVERINTIIESRVEATVDSVLDKVLNGAAVITVNREQKTITKHIQDIFSRSNTWNNPQEKISAIAKTFSSELNLQYNNVFAMNIVSSMKEQGLLKDDVVKMLLEEPQAPSAPQVTTKRT